MVEVVTLGDMKAHLSLTADFGDADDMLITNKIAAATAHVELATGVIFDEINDVPEDLREAVRLLAAHLYENREATIFGVSVAPIPLGFDDLIRPHRVEWF